MGLYTVHVQLLAAPGQCDRPNASGNVCSYPEWRRIVASNQPARLSATFSPNCRRRFTSASACRREIVDLFTASSRGDIREARALVVVPSEDKLFVPAQAGQRRPDTVGQLPVRQFLQGRGLKHRFRPGIVVNTRYEKHGGH